MERQFIDEVQPNRPRSKTIDWPFPYDGDKPPQVVMRVLGCDELEAAYLETVDHFEALERDLKPEDIGFRARERAGLVLRAYRTVDDRQIANSTDELMRKPSEIRDGLYLEWSRFQSEVTVRPATSEQLEQLVDALKKNFRSVPLNALPSTWLIALITTLASQPDPSTLANGVG
jgi:hypothetical protein